MDDMLFCKTCGNDWSNIMVHTGKCMGVSKVNISSIIPQIHADTIANGGGTFRHNGTHVTSGFAVATIHDTFAIVDIDDKPAFERAIIALVAVHPLDCIGTWVHEGRIYIDPSYVTKDETFARNMARNHNQLAYYNITEGIEVML